MPDREHRSRSAMAAPSSGSGKKRELDRQARARGRLAQHAPTTDIARAVGPSPTSATPQDWEQMLQDLSRDSLREKVCQVPF